MCDTETKITNCEIFEDRYVGEGTILGEISNFNES